jgi:hypothetical protein
VLGGGARRCHHRDGVGRGHSSHPGPDCDRIVSGGSAPRVRKIMLGGPRIFLTRLSCNPAPRVRKTTPCAAPRSTHLSDSLHVSYYLSSSSSVSSAPRAAAASSKRGKKAAGTRAATRGRATSVASAGTAAREHFHVVIHDQKENKNMCPRPPVHVGSYECSACMSMAHV